MARNADAARAESAPGETRVRTWGWRLVIIGAVCQAAGLAIDVWLHANDPTLAAREALLTFDNLGHVLLIGGIGLVLVGIGIALVGPRLARAPRFVQVAVPLLVAVIVGASSVVAANSSLARGHDHESDPAAQATHAAHGHGDGTELPPKALDAATRTALAKQLRQARDVADAYPTANDAKAAGYRAVTPYLPLIGAHYMRLLAVDGTFDIEQPEMLLYDERGKVVGLSYYVRSETEPEGFVGPNDHWHRHIGLCVDADNPFVLGDEQTTEEECRRRGGVKAPGADGWMVHAWVVPGWESTQGVFSAENAQLQ
jgi:hypothetical protein